MQDGQGPWERLLAVAVTVAGMAVIMWLEAPPWQREMVSRGVRLRCRRFMSAVAARSGRRAMRDELAGRKAEADAGYGFTYRLSSIRDRL